MKFEMNGKELELEMQLFEENGALNLEYQKDALDLKDLDSDDDADPSMRSRYPLKWNERRNRDTSFWRDRLERSNKPEKAYKQNFEGSKNEPENTSRVNFDEAGHASHDHQIKSVTV